MFAKYSRGHIQHTTQITRKLVTLWDYSVDIILFGKYIEHCYGMLKNDKRMRFFTFRAILEMCVHILENLRINFI